jgi:diphthine-ammonia ligase
VKSLPKNALIEKQVLFHTGRCPVKSDEEDEATLQSRVPVTNKGEERFFNVQGSIDGGY